MAEKDGKVQIKPEDMKEISFIGDDRISYSRLGRALSFNPDTLIGKKGLQIYDKMLTDNQVIAVQTMKKMAILQSGWSLIPASEDSIDKEIAEKVEWDFIKMRGTLTDRLWDILSSKDYGFSVTEKIYWIVNEGIYKGKVGLKDLKTRRPHSFTFETDEFGNLLSLSQNNLYGVGPGNSMSPDKFVILVNNKNFSNWFGQSDLRSIYSNWWSKYNHIKWWNMYGERHGMPIALATYEKGTPATIQSDLKDIVKVIQTQMSAMLPPGTDIKFLEAASRGGGANYFQTTLNYHDMAIAKGLLMPQLLGISTQGGQGSYAQSKTQFDIFVLMIEMIRKQLEEEVMNEQIIRPLVDFNYVVEEYPTFKFNPLTSEDKFEIAKTWIEVVTGGLSIPDLKDENRLRELLGFEERDEEIEVTPTPTKPKEPLPEKEIPEEDIDEQSLKMFRQPDQIESKVDFARIDKEQNRLVERYQELLVELFDKQRVDLIDLVGRKIDKGTLDTRFVNKELILKKSGSINTRIREFIVAGFNLGKSDMNREAGKSNYAMDPVLPKNALKFLEEKRFWITDILNTDILNEVKYTLLEGIKNGISRREMEAQVADIYAPYIGIPSTAQAPFRIETVLRTNLSEVYNMGRVIQAQSPELTDYIVGMEYSEILDSRTAPVSRYIDGKKIKMTDPDFHSLSYPLHYNDRGLFVPVTTDDLPVEWITDAQKRRVKNLMGNFKRGK